MDAPEKGNRGVSTEETTEVFQVNVQLPTGETLTLQTKGSSSVRDLKIIVEVKSGVPSDLFTLVHKRAEENNIIKLSDETKMADIHTFIDLDAASGSVTFELSIPPWWERFVHRCMQLDNRQILKRICIKMNQISSEDRAFVAAFIAAQKGDGQLFQTLLGGDVKVDVQRTVQCSGRTLLHAAVAGGNFSCAAVIFMNGGWPLLSKPDQQGVTPMDSAKNTNQKDLVELLGHYVELQSRETSEIESTADETLDVDVDVDAGELRDNGQDEDSVKHERENGLSESPPQDLVIQNEVTENSGKGTVDETLNEVMAKLEIERVNQEREQDEEVSERSYGHVRTGSHRRLFRESNIEGKLHKPLRASKSIDSHDGFSSVNCIFTRIDEIRPLSAKAVPGARQREEKLPRVNTPPSSPINSPRMRRKLVPSPLNPERPGSPVLYPRSPSSPRPMSPLVCRSRSATSPGMRPSLAPSYNSPDLRRKAMTLSGGETRRERKMSKEMQDFLYSHYDRESKPWNVWKTVRKSQLDQFDVSDDDSSSEEENEKLAKFLKNSKSDRRKTFEMWLTDKEAQQIRRQTALAGMAKQEAIRKRKEAHWRQINGKTHQEWLEELRSDNMKSREPTEGEQSDERKVEAIRKYQEWLRAKDEEALKREDQLRKEAAAKFTESQQKRDEKLQRAWFKKKLFSTS